MGQIFWFRIWSEFLKLASYIFRYWPFIVLASYVDGLHLFWIFQKIAHAHISGSQNNNNLKEEHAESSEHPVNRVPTSFVSVDFEKNPVAQHLDVQIEGQLLLYNFIVYLQWNDILSKE